MSSKLKIPSLKNISSKKMKRWATDWGKYLQVTYWIKDLYLQHMKNSQNSKEKTEIGNNYN